MRAQVRVDRGRLTVRSRPGRDCTEEFPELNELVGSIGRRRLLLDGELVCFAPDGAPDFAALRKRLSPRRPQRKLPPATLVIFDVLHAGGRAVRSLAYRERRGLLDELALEGPPWRTPACFVGEAQARLRRAAREGLGDHDTV